MNNKTLIRGFVESIGDEFIHYKLSLGNCIMIIGEEQIDDVIDVLTKIRESKIEEFGRIKTGVLSNGDNST